jgi:hypothetical protein
MQEVKPDVVILAAARVGGIHANASRPADFLDDNLALQTNVIHSAAERWMRRRCRWTWSCRNHVGGRVAALLRGDAVINQVAQHILQRARRSSRASASTRSNISGGNRSRAALHSRRDASVCGDGGATHCVLVRELRNDAISALQGC